MVGIKNEIIGNFFLSKVKNLLFIHLISYLFHISKFASLSRKESKNLPDFLLVNLSFYLKKNFSFKYFFHTYFLASELMDKEFESMVSSNSKVTTNGTSKENDE